MSFILSDILHSTAHSQYVMVHGIVGAWLSSPRTFIGSWSVWGFPHCGICPIAGYYPLIVRFPSTDIILPLWGKTKWVMCEFFHQYHIPLCHGIVGTRKPSPRTFIGQWAGGAYPTLCIVGYGGMSVCRHCVSFAYIIIIQDGGGKSNEKICFNIF